MLLVLATTSVRSILALVVIKAALPLFELSHTNGRPDNDKVVAFVVDGKISLSTFIVTCFPIFIYLAVPVNDTPPAEFVVGVQVPSS